MMEDYDWIDYILILILFFTTMILGFTLILLIGVLL